MSAIRGAGCMALALALAGVAAGCGNRTAPDLFELVRTGAGPGAGLALRVSDDGRVRCNGGPGRRMPDGLLLDAREAARELADEAARDVSLPPRPGSQLRYRLRLEDGSVTFSDNSRRQRPEMFEVQALTRRIARETCGLAR